MMSNPFDDAQSLRAEIATAAARLIAEDGADYGTAKRKAARQVLGETQVSSKLLPDNDMIEQAVRRYQALFFADSQPARLLRLRGVALDVMAALASFQPYLVGAVLNGTAGQHAHIHLQLFADSAKEVEIFLLNKNIDIDISESPHFKGPRYDAVETVGFLWEGEAVLAELYELDDLRGARKPRADGKAQRLDIDGVRKLLQTTDNLLPINS